jgi:peptide/nickel transport system substrate-binding protein
MRLTLKDDLSSLDPAFAPGPPEFQLQYMTCAMLLNYPDAALPEGGGLEPEVAASAPRISDGGRTYTFTIRPGFRFSPPSGAPVTAQTFKYTLERALSRRLKSPAALFLADIVGFDAYRAGRTRHLAGVSVRGNQLVIRLRSPAGDLPARLAFPNFCPVPIGTPAEATGIVPPSAGPYYIASYVPDHLILLKRNPNYHGPRPRRPAEIEYRIGLSGDRATAAVAAGRADYVADGIAPEARPRLSTRYGPESAAARQGRQRYFVGPFAGIAYLALNTSRPLFANARLRRAVSYAVDRTALAGEEVRATDRPGIFAGNPFDHYLPPAVPGSPAGHVYPLRPNVAKARALAGRDRRRAVLYTCAEPPCPQEAQILATNLKQIGIDLEIHELPLEVLYSEIFSPQRRYDIVRLRWLGYFDPYDFLNALFAGPETRPIDSVNASRFDSRTWNRQLVAAARLSPPRRYVRFAQLDRMLTREAAPAVVYASYVGDAFFSARIGCQLYQPVYGIDLGRLCIRK